MDSDRKNAMFAGILLLMGFSGVFISAFTGPVMNSGEYLIRIAGSGNRLAWGALFQLIMAFSCSGIAVFLFPALKRQNEALALWAVVLRAFETVLFIAASLGLLLLIALSREYVKADLAEIHSLQAMGSLIRSAYDWSSAVLGILAWSLGALIYHILFFQSRLVPRWLSGWGILGAPLAMAACVLTMFGAINSSSTINTVLTLPLGLQEIPLALWLIIKGFRVPVSHA
jgi:hypothetical protein